MVFRFRDVSKRAVRLKRNIWASLYNEMLLVPGPEMDTSFEQRTSEQVLGEKTEAD